MSAESRRPLFWIASGLRDLKGMPVPVRKACETALRDMQYGETPAIAKPQSGFGGGSVLELVDDHDSRTARIPLA
jgi:phage-related protein